MLTCITNFDDLCTFVDQAKLTGLPGHTPVKLIMPSPVGLTSSVVVQIRDLVARNSETGKSDNSKIVRTITISK